MPRLAQAMNIGHQGKKRHHYSRIVLTAAVGSLRRQQDTSCSIRSKWRREFHKQENTLSSKSRTRSYQQTMFSHLLNPQHPRLRIDHIMKQQRNSRYNSSGNSKILEPTPTNCRPAASSASPQIHAARPAADLATVGSDYRLPKRVHVG